MSAFKDDERHIEKGKGRVPPRKEAVAVLLDAGLEIDEIAERLDMSRKSVLNYRSKIRKDAQKRAKQTGLARVERLDELRRLRHRLYRTLASDPASMHKTISQLLKVNKQEMDILAGGPIPEDDSLRRPATTREIVNAILSGEGFHS